MLEPFFVPHFSGYIYLFAIVVVVGVVDFSSTFSYFFLRKCHSTCDKCIIILFCVSSFSKTLCTLFGANSLEKKRFSIKVVVLCVNHSVMCVYVWKGVWEKYTLLRVFSNLLCSQTYWHTHKRHNVSES